MDVKNTFMHDDLEEDIYIRQLLSFKANVDNKDS